MPGALCLMITSTLESPIVCDIEKTELSLLGNCEDSRGASKRLIDQSSVVEFGI